MIRAEEGAVLSIGDESTDCDVTQAELAELQDEWARVSGLELKSFFEYGPGSVAPKNWVGMLSGPTTSLEVRPGGSGSLTSTQRDDLDQTLGRLIQLSLGDPPKESGIGSTSHGTRFERAVEAFCAALTVARRRQMSRRYRLMEGRTSTPRGTIVFPRQALTQLTRPAQFESRWVEQSPDTDVNRFFRGVLAFAKTRTAGPVRRRVDELDASLEAALQPDSPLALHANLRLDRLPNEYRSAVRIGHGILTGDVAGILHGSRDLRSEIVALPRLFEAFVHYAVNSVAQRSGMSAVRKPRGLYLGHWDHLQGIPERSGIPEMELDTLVYGTDGRPRLVVDAKWKKLKPTSRTLGLTSNDLYQVLSYGQHLYCSEALLIFPWIGSTRPWSSWMRSIRVDGSAAPFRIWVLAVPLVLPASEPVTRSVEAALETVLA